MQRAAGSVQASDVAYVMGLFKDHQAAQEPEETAEQRRIRLQQERALVPDPGHDGRTFVDTDAPGEGGRAYADDFKEMAARRSATTVR